MSEAKKIVGVTLLLMGVTFLSRIIGFIRTQVIAFTYGTSQEADAFIMAFTFPTLLLTITGGALSASLIPMIIRLKNQEETIRVKKLIGSVFSVTTLLMVVFTLLFYLFIEQFTGIYAGSLSEEGQQLTLHMLKISLLSFLAIGVISLFTSVLNAFQHYVVPSLGPIFYSLGVIVATIFFSSSFGVESLMVGMTIGIVVHLLVALAVVWYKKISFSPRVWWNEDMKQVGILTFPILISIGAFQLNTIVDRYMASGLDEGSVTALNFGHTVTQLPLSLFVGSMVLPLFPMIADKLSRQDETGTKQLLTRSYRLLAILLLPVIGAFILLAEPLIAILFQRGAFDHSSVQMTSIALAFYAISILPFAMRDVITRTFYSMQDTWTPVINSVLLVVVNITLMLILVPRFGMMGVAGSTSIAAVFAYVRLHWKLQKKLGSYREANHYTIWWRIWRNALLFSLTLWLCYQGLLLIWEEPTGIQLWLRILISFTLAGVGYSWITLRLKIAEIDWLKDRVKAIIKRKSQASQY